MPRFFAEGGKQIGADFPVTDKMIIGRKKTCEIVLDDGRSSREHTLITKEGGSHYVKDLNSSNGTYLNDVRIDKSPLVFGDRVRIGDTVLVFLDDPEQSLEGQTIGGFQIVEKLGHRDIGIVYRARQIALDRIVSLKFLDKDLSGDKQFVMRFIEEARVAGTLRHPNIVHIFDVGTANGQYYICMEYISGKTLRDALTEGALTLGDKVRIAKECASALGFAHGRGIIHKDVTPSNIILTHENVAKVSDMGIAKLSGAPISGREISSLYYISPEEALAQPIGPKSDMYSLGVCFYEMLAGELPFKANSAREIVKEHIITPVPSPRECAPEVPEPVARICVRMTARELSGRYPSMGEVVADLEKIDLSPARRRARSPVRPARPARPPSPARVGSKPLFVDDGSHEGNVEPRARVKTGSGVLGLILFVIFLVILFYISSFVTQLLMEQFSNRPAP